MALLLVAARTSSSRWLAYAPGSFPSMRSAFAAPEATPACARVSSPKAAAVVARACSVADTPVVSVRSTSNAADSRVDLHARHRGLDDCLHLIDGDGPEVGDVAGALRNRRREAERRVRRAPRHLQAARGAGRVAGEGEPRARGGLASGDGGVDGRGDLGGGGLRDVGEVDGGEGDALLWASVDAHEQRHAVSQGEGAGAGGERCCGTREHRG